MTDRARDEENASPVELPLFAGPSVATHKQKRGRTYARPKEALKRRSTSTSSGGVKKKKRRKSSNGRRRSSGGKNNGTPRCALQTLGGTRTAGPLKGSLSDTTEATLKKMRGYGGKLFYDKCYLSSDDDGGADSEGAEATFPWALSPPADGDVIPFADGDSNKRNTKKNAKKTAKVTAAVPSSGTPLQLVSSSRRGSSVVGDSRDRHRNQSDYDAGSSSEEDAEEGGGGDDAHLDRESSEEEWEMSTASTKRSSGKSKRPVPAAPRARRTPGTAESSKAAGRKAKAKPFRARGSNATTVDSSTVPRKKMAQAKAPAAATSSASGDGTTPARHSALVPGSRVKGRSPVAFGRGLKC